MDRNTEAFYTGAELHEGIQRSTWPRPFTYKGTFNTGQIVPFFCDLDVLPGMTIKNRSSYVIRMNTPKYPTMDNLYLDTYWFKIPYRTIWKNWCIFNGENESGSWAITTEKEIPMFKTDATHTVGIHDINCHMGLRPLSQIKDFSQMGVRAYIRTYNYWFRDQNLIAPLTMYDDDSDRTLDGTTLTGGTMLKAAKFHDYFTSALPQAQKTDPTAQGIYAGITIPIGTTAPVKGTGEPMVVNRSLTRTALSDNNYSLYKQTTSGIDYIASGQGTGSDGIGLTTDATKSGLIADLSQAVAATVNAQRLAFATQRILEHDAMFGTRYLQETVGRFGVNARFDEVIPEYLGGSRIPLNIQQTVQNSSTDATSPLGFTGAFSVTANTNEDFVKSFQEHCVVLGLAVVRADHTYQQGVARQWTRKRRLDFYWPELSHIGNQPIYNYEIYSQGSGVTDTDGNIIDDQVFGYKEAWAEYKFKNSVICGELNSEYATSLDAWHYGDDYNTLPVLSQNWIEEPSTFVDRTLLVQSNTHDQFTADIFVEQTITAPMPIHCNPGLIDHF